MARVQKDERVCCGGTWTVLVTAHDRNLIGSNWIGGNVELEVETARDRNLIEGSWSEKETENDV